TYRWTVGRLRPAISAAFCRVRPQCRSHATSILRRTCASGWESRSAFTTRCSSMVKVITNAAMSGVSLRSTTGPTSSSVRSLPPRRVTPRSFLPPRRGGFRWGLRLRLDLRDQLLEVRPAAEGVEVRLLQFTGKGPADLDDGGEGGDGLVGKRLRIGRRHAGLRVGAQPGQERQRPRPLELHIDSQLWELGPKFEGPPQVGGGFGRLPGAGPGPAAVTVTLAELPDVKGILGVRLGQFLTDDQALVENGKCLRQSFLAIQRSADVGVDIGQIRLELGVGGVVNS